MGKDVSQRRPLPLSSRELEGVACALELSWPPAAIVKGAWWPGVEGRRNYRVTVWAAEAAPTPLCSTWIAERSNDVFRLMTRPATTDELETLLGALRELDALEYEGHEPIAEAQYDCRQRSYQLCFTPLEEMLEGMPYRRWVFRRHADGRPLSVGYICETRRGSDYATLADGAILRGSPWGE
jgi:hypothetical protein